MTEGRFDAGNGNAGFLDSAGTQPLNGVVGVWPRRRRRHASSEFVGDCDRAFAVGASRCCDSTSRSWSRARGRSVRARLPPRRLPPPSRRRGSFRATLPLFLGGHSYGGRMASHAILEHDLGDVRGLIFCSFPLHTAGAPATTRAKHLRDIERPMLFLSGTRDALADPDLLRGVVAGIGPRAELVWLDTADHGYKVLKRSRARSDTVFEELADAAAAFVTRVC